MIFTVFPTRFGAVACPRDESLAEFADTIRNTTAASKDKLPLMKQATFGAVKTDKGSLRHDGNVLTVTGVEADYDGESVSFGQATEIIRKAEIEALLYTSPSHSSAKPRWRVMCPFSGALPPAERTPMLGRLEGLFRSSLGLPAVFGAESWALSQSYYFGRVNGAPVPLVAITEGFALDRRDDLDAVACGKPGTTGGGNGRDSGPLDEQAMLDAIFSRDSFHLSCTRLLGKWAYAGVPMMEADARLRCAFEGILPPDRDARWRDRYRDIERCVMDIYGSEAKKRDERPEFVIGSGFRSASENGDATAVGGIEKLRLADWLSREIALPDRLLGSVLSTTSRMLLVGPTGLGKTNLAMAMTFAVGHGGGFLDWLGSGTARSVLYVDGEMPARLMRERLEDAARRSGGEPSGVFVLSREDFPDMAPLNIPAGRTLIENAIELVGGVDLVVFDNLQALTLGDMKDELGWQQLLPWIRDLTRRRIGQVWVHHTGHDESHSYGTKTREWQLDTVALLERVEQPAADIAFRLVFSKARERTPGNRSDFEPITVTLADDKWTAERSGASTRTRKPATDRALELFKDALTREGTIPPASDHIPLNTLCVTEGLWRRYCEKGLVSESNPDPAKQADATRQAFKRAAEKLIGTKIGKWDLWLWLIK